jgi:hypothetical protein
MGIQIQGNGGTISEVDGATYRAIRTVARPIDPVSALGHYHFASVTGTMAAALAAGGIFFAFRWGDASRLAVVYKIQVGFQALTAFTAATLVDFGFDAHLGRTYTASHTGGTAVTLTGNNLKTRTSMGSTLATDIRIATTAALGGGTITLDANPFANSIGDPQRVNPAAATEEQRVNDPTLEWSPDVASGQAPIVLAQNEGIVLRNRAVWPAAGTGVFRCVFAWAEVDAY